MKRARSVLRDGAPELIAAVEQGTVAVSTAALIAEQPEQEQKEIVARGEKEILAAARAIRERKQSERRQQRIVMLDEAAGPARPSDCRRARRSCWRIPPWQHAVPISDGRRIENNYSTMSLDEICAVPVSNVIMDDCLLYLWGDESAPARGGQSDRRLGLHLLRQPCLGERQARDREAGARAARIAARRGARLVPAAGAVTSA